MKFRLEVIERGVVFAYISGFPDDLRDNLRFEKDGFRVLSTSFAELSFDYICLPGRTRDYDHRLAVFNFPSYEEAVAYREKVLDTLTAWWREYRGKESKPADGVIDLEDLI